MPRKIRQLKADFRKVGARLIQERGDHEKWKHDSVPDLYVELAGNDGDDAKPYQEKQVRALLRRIDDLNKGQQA
ncbi:MAG: type II toxin-antitoxin system HicA family toxin [Ktedonobacterales bacterium]|nr:type II toxin-antitoxin system HicA family toxin [Ktedonobacterales bacterium]